MKIPHIFHIVRYWCICKKSFSVVMKLSWLGFEWPPHPQTSILNKLWNSIKSFIIPANFDYQWTFVQMNFNDFTVTENDLVNFYKILSLPAMAMTLNDLVVLGEWCMTIIMVMSNKCFRCQPQTTVLTNQKTQHKNSICPIKPQCVEYNFIMAVLIHCEQLW